MSKFSESEINNWIRKWAPPDLNRSLCLPKAQVYQANPRARVSPSIPFIDKRVSRRIGLNRCCVQVPS